jgi:DNA-binding transcriptional ArsR family regulator
MVVRSELTEEEIDLAFHALADRTRRDILNRTFTQEQSISDLTKRYDMSFAAVQKHVAVLEKALLVNKQRHGREQIVQANGTRITTIAALLDRYEQLWRSRVNQINDILQTSSTRKTK